VQFCKKRFLLPTIVFLAISVKAQDLNLYFAKNRVVRSSVVLFDYKEPVSVRVVEGMGGGDVSRPFLPALVCDDSIRMGASLDCYEARTKSDIFWDDPHVEFVDISGNGQGVIFSANLNYSGSGATLLWTLLVLDHAGVWKNLFPEITTSDQNDHLFWHSVGLSPYGIFSVADFIWGGHDTHFGSHRYQIKSYTYCRKLRKYALADEFATQREFPQVDEAAGISVIRPELPKIQRRLQKKAESTCR